MSAPVPGIRTEPPGTVLEEGYRVTIGFATNLNINLWEKEVTPPGIDSGELIDITTQWNNTLRTKAFSAIGNTTPISLHARNSVRTRTDWLDIEGTQGK